MCTSHWQKTMKHPLKSRARMPGSLRRLHYLPHQVPRGQQLWSISLPVIFKMLISSTAYKNKPGGLERELYKSAHSWIGEEREEKLRSWQLWKTVSPPPPRRPPFMPLSITIVLFRPDLAACGSCLRLGKAAVKKETLATLLPNRNTPGLLSVSAL